MQAYICTVCGYLYDIQSADRSIEDNSIPFEELDPEWRCPVCSVGQDLFIPADSHRVPDVPISSKK